MTLYVVQVNDTLAGIAAQFSVPEAEIRAANHLITATLSADRELMIPICKSTPTGTLDPLTSFTPALSPTTSTPGGYILINYYTQACQNIQIDV
jgi:LysM repeat protein